MSESSEAGPRTRERVGSRGRGPDISVGQRWSEATGVARRAGYQLEDASQLAMDPAPDGFYVNMPGKRGLIVYRDARTNTVKSMEWVENWPGPKAPRVYHDVRSFDVPSADPAAP